MIPTNRGNEANYLDQFINELNIAYENRYYYINRCRDLGSIPDSFDQYSGTIDLLAYLYRNDATFRKLINENNILAAINHISITADEARRKYTIWNLDTLRIHIQNHDYNKVYGLFESNTYGNALTMEQRQGWYNLIQDFYQKVVDGSYIELEIIIIIHAYAYHMVYLLKLFDAQRKNSAYYCQNIQFPQGEHY